MSARGLASVLEAGADLAIMRGGIGAEWPHLQAGSEMLDGLEVVVTRVDFLAPW
jgi:hypothetical protein